MNVIVDDIQASGKLNAIQNRQLRNIKNKAVQWQGLLSSRQLTPSSYEKLADVVDALQQQNCNLAQQMLTDIQNDRKLRTATRSWLTTLKQLNSLTSVALS